MIRRIVVTSLGLFGLIASLASAAPVAPRMQTLQPIGIATEIRGETTRTATAATGLRIADVRVTVPETLKVSEANVFYPMADIVWRGDPRGDRRAQIVRIFEEAGTRAARGLGRKGQAVVVDITVRRFHCLTEKARFALGGVHSVKFDMALRDARTGERIGRPWFVVADIPAAGGQRAMIEDAQGRTQRVVVVEYLAAVIAREVAGRGAADALAAAP
jgi:hypothetical protein